MEEKEKKLMGEEPLPEEALQEVAGGVGEACEMAAVSRAASSDPALKDPIRKLNDPFKGDNVPFGLSSSF